MRDQIPLDYPYPSQIKRALGKAHAELEEKGFLSGVEYKATPACSTASRRPSPAGRRRSNSPAPPGDVRHRAPDARGGARRHGEGPRRLPRRRKVPALRRGPRRPGGHPQPLAFSSAPSARATPSPSPRSQPRRPRRPPGSQTPPRSEKRSRTPSSPPPPPPSDPAAEELWSRVLEHAEEEIDASSLRVWFGAVTAVTLGSNSLTISLPTPSPGVHRDTLQGGARRRATSGALAGRGPARRRRCQWIEQERMGINIILGGLLFAVFLYLLPWFCLSCDTTRPCKYYR